MKRIVGLSLVCVLLGSSTAFAANIAVITSPPTMLKFVVFGVVVGCLVASVKLLGVLKGGLLFKSWQIFMFAFAALGLAQLAGLLSDFEIFALPDFVTPALWVVVCALFLYGIFEAKKILD
ncbi:MAG: hypothetical protein JSV52_09715 [Candidatus Zixiibacteriota bacterium]|nr:MAG: hypothetical protein JSV52_09715 [candidate division Zixibacteria bacterium]